MAKRWSKLQKRLYNLMDSEINFQIHCVLYEMRSLNHYGRRMPRYFITIGKDIIFDYPKDMNLERKRKSLWASDADEISDLIEEYIQRPRDALLAEFPNDEWELTDILLACDRRMGKRRLEVLAKRTKNEKVQEIISKRRVGNYADK